MLVGALVHMRCRHVSKIGGVHPPFLPSPPFHLPEGLTLKPAKGFGDHRAMQAQDGFGAF